MKTFSVILAASLFFFLGLPVPQTGQQKFGPLSEDGMVASAKSDQKGQGREPIKTIDDFEKQKMIQMKKNIGKRLMAVKTVRPAEFYESPDNLKRKIPVREKEEFVILDVVQNQSGTMNFYKVKLESGKIGYLGADGSNLELRIKDGSIMTVTKRLGKKKPPSSSVMRERASRAIEMVKNHLIPSDPVSKDKRSVERRMMEIRATSLPGLKWKYEAKEIGSSRYRVTQHAEGESDRVIVRTWIVDLATSKVSAENPAARALYR